MKKTSKALLLGLCALLLVGASVLGTMAYLTSTDTVENKFTVGNVGITLDEANVDINGDQEDNTRVKTNDYKLLPSHNYKKDPTIHVTDRSEPCYLFVKVDNEIADILISADDKTDEKKVTLANQMAAHGWTNVQDNIYVYGTSKDAAPIVVNPDDENVEGANGIVVFDTFTIDDAVDGTTLARFDKKEITVTAYAIQKDGFDGKTAAEIWTASKFN